MVECHLLTSFSKIGNPYLSSSSVGNILRGKSRKRSEMQRKPLAPPSTDNKQVKEYTDAVKRGLNTYFVAPSKLGWNVYKARDKQHAKFYVTKHKAVTHARHASISGADVVVYDKDGNVTLIQVKDNTHEQG